MRIESISTTGDSGALRVSAIIEGAPLWFESADVALRAAPEAFASAMLIHATARGEALILEEPLCPLWLSNALHIQSVFREWFGYPATPPPPTNVISQNISRLESTSLCFSGGVDSFYTLLRSGYGIHYLVFVIGFDMRLEDVARAAAFESSLRAVAAETGARPVVIRSNIREHPAFNSISWEFTHGGALAAIGHLLSGVAGQLLISSSRSLDEAIPWGSHWMIDEFWSSERLRVNHVGAELLRRQKLIKIAAEPLVRQHLRVCWENRAPTGNCSRCEKCIRTQLSLLECGALANFTMFDGEDSLAQHIDALPPSRGRLKTHRRLSRKSDIRPDIRRALSRLIERSDQANQPASGARKNILKWLWNK